MMRDESFQCFIDEFGEATHHNPVPVEEIKKWHGKLPDQLLHYWETEGWSSYQDGLFRLVNPDDYEDILDLWLEDTEIGGEGSFHVFAMTAFGKLYACEEQKAHVLKIYCPTGEIFFTQNNSSVKKEIDDNILDFFPCLSLDNCDMIDDNERPLFKRAINKLGVLEGNEIFGFEPALFLGGVGLISNLKKLSAPIHLDILGRFAEPNIYY